MLGPEPYVMTADQLISIAENAEHYQFPVRMSLPWIIERIDLDGVHVGVPSLTYARDGSMSTPDHRMHVFMSATTDEIVEEFVIDVSQRDLDCLLTSEDFYILTRSLEARKRVVQ